MEVIETWREEEEVNHGPFIDLLCCFPTGKTTEFLPFPPQVVQPAPKTAKREGWVKSREEIEAEEQAKGMVSTYQAITFTIILNVIIIRAEGSGKGSKE